MTTASLIRRRNQIQLLETACDERQQARLKLRTPGGSNQSTETMMLAVARDGLWLGWPGQSGPVSGDAGLSVEVTFERDGEQYWFTADTCGRDDDPPMSAGPGPALRLTLPVCVQQAERRNEIRIDLEDHETIEATLVEMGGDCAHDVITVKNLSTGGLGGVMNADRTFKLSHRSMFWAEFQLGDDPKTFDFAVRLIHVRPMDGDLAFTGWAFCPADDEVAYRANLERLQDFVNTRRSTGQC